MCKKQVKRKLTVCDRETERDREKEWGRGERGAQQKRESEYK